MPCRKKIFHRKILMSIFKSQKWTSHNESFAFMETDLSYVEILLYTITKSMYNHQVKIYNMCDIMKG